MKALVTGATGTIGSELRQQLEAQKVETIAWNRKLIPTNEYHKMEAFIRSVQPDFLFHLAYTTRQSSSESECWNINYEWTSELAWITRNLNVKFVFASTNLVFSNKNQGPYSITSIPDAEAGYGYEKRRAEERVFYQNADAFVIRLGWQIGEKPGSNNMIDYFERKMKESGEVTASIHWKPACSFLPDTCEKLFEIASKYSPGLYMLDSNRHWNFFEIAAALNNLHDHRWNIKRSEDFVADTRMVDDRIGMSLLSARLDLPEK